MSYTDYTYEAIRKLVTEADKEYIFNAKIGGVDTQIKAIKYKPDDKFATVWIYYLKDGEWIALPSTSPVRDKYEV